MEPARAQNQTLALIVGTTEQISEGLAFRAYGVEADNFTDRWVEIPGVGRFVAPQSSRTIRLDGPTVARARFGAPGTTPNPAGKAGQVCTLTFTETELPTTGSPSVSQTVAITQAPSTIFAAFAQLRARTDAAGDVTIAGPTTIDLPIKFYRDLTVSAGIILTAGFRLQLVVARNVIFGDATSRISAKGLGYSGGTGVEQSSPQGQGHAGNGFSSIEGSIDAILVASGAAAGTAGAGAAAKVAHLLSYLAVLYSNVSPFGAIAGGGGGSGGGCVSNFGQAGGAGGAGIGGGGAGGNGSNNSNDLGGDDQGGTGGGVLVVISDDVQTAAGTIEADGNNGTSPSIGHNQGGGGGGSGGLAVLFVRNSPSVAPILRANGGVGAAGGSLGGGAGGPGGAGLATMIQLT